MGTPADTPQVFVRLDALLPDVSRDYGGGLDEEGEEVCVLSSGTATVQV